MHKNQIEEELINKPNDPNLLTSLANIEIASKRYQNAIDIWERLVIAHPEEIWGYQGITNTLLLQDKFLQADSYILPTLRLFPYSIHLHLLWASIPARQYNFKEAASRYSKLYKKWPSDEEIILNLALQFLYDRNYDEADELLNQAIKNHPNNIEVVIISNLVLEARGRWEAAEYSWGELNNKHPNNTRILIGLGRSILFQNNNFEKALSVFKSAIAIEAQNIDALRNIAYCHSKLGNVDDCERSWLKIIDTNPEDAYSYSGYAVSMRELGNFKKAKLILAKAEEMFPQNYHILYQSAITYSLEKNWETALDYWLKTVLLRPGDTPVIREAVQYINMAKLELEVNEEAKFSIPNELNNLGIDNSDDNKLLFMGFESIGDDCEFGIVQRQFGAEPLGLLRWTLISPSNLCSLLYDRLSFIGVNEYTRIEVVNGEYTTRIDKYDMFSHTFTREAEFPFDRFKKQQIKRMHYLKEKLLNDFIDGDKVFVYKSSSGLSYEEIERIRLALSSISEKAKLLCVKLADDIGKPGEVVRQTNNLFIGYIDKFSTRDSSSNLWLNICKKVRLIISSN